jgi:hypothetical protein
MPDHNHEQYYSETECLTKFYTKTQVNILIQDALQDLINLEDVLMIHHHNDEYYTKEEIDDLLSAVNESIENLRSEDAQNFGKKKFQLMTDMEINNPVRLINDSGIVKVDNIYWIEDQEESNYIISDPLEISGVDYDSILRESLIPISSSHALAIYADNASIKIQSLLIDNKELTTIAEFTLNNFVNDASSVCGFTSNPYAFIFYCVKNSSSIMFNRIQFSTSSPPYFQGLSTTATLQTMSVPIKEMKYVPLHGYYFLLVVKNTNNNYQLVLCERATTAINVLDVTTEWAFLHVDIQVTFDHQFIMFAITKDTNDLQLNQYSYNQDGLGNNLTFYDLGIGSAETVFSLKLLHQNYINLFFYHTNIDTNDLHLQYMAIDSSGSIVSERRLIESAVLSSNRFNQFEGFISETGEFNVIMSSNITPASSWQTVHSRFTPNYNMSGLFNDTFINAIYNHIILDKPSIYIDVLPINDGTSFLLFSTIDNDSRSIKYVEGGKFGVLIFNYTDQYFGILQSSGLAGEEHVVSFAGGMSQTHVGLVPLIDYYIQNDGTITDFETPIKIGRSISDTEILLK